MYGTVYVMEFRGCKLSQILLTLEIFSFNLVWLLHLKYVVSISFLSAIATFDRRTFPIGN